MAPATRLFPALLAFAAAQAMPPFIVRSIAPAGRTSSESLLAADIDKDGDLDFFSGEGRGGRSWWFERTASGWNRRLVSDSDLTDVGAALLDVDGDGWIDKVASGFWYRNPGFPPGGLPAGAPDPVFTPCRYSDVEFVHDLYVADMDGDGRKDVVMMWYDGIRWLRTPPPDSACGPWEEHLVNGNTSPQQHGGIAVGDLDGDGDMDVSRVDRWYENADGKGTAWIEHVNIPFGENGLSGWGLSGRARILDLDGDGHNDLVETESDVPNGRVAWFANPDGKGLRWVEHLVKDSTDGQDFHSLLLEDFDGDGDLDIFSAGAGSSAGTPKSYIWENLDGKGGSWKEHVIFDGPQSIHEATAADLDGDGDMDILAVNWDDGAHYYLENQLVPNSGSGIRSVGARYARKRGRGATAIGNRAVFPLNGRLRDAKGRLQAPEP